MIGVFGIIAGVASMVAIKEPGRGVFDFADEFRQNATGNDSVSQKKAIEEQKKE